MIEELWVAAFLTTSQKVYLDLARGAEANQGGITVRLWTLLSPKRFNRRSEILMILLNARFARYRLKTTTSASSTIGANGPAPILRMTVSHVPTGKNCCVKCAGAPMWPVGCVWLYLPNSVGGVPAIWRWRLFVSTWRPRVLAYSMIYKMNLQSWATFQRC